VKAFVARNVLHDQIHTQLHTHAADASTRTLAVWGLGGTGKTQLVLDYVQRHRTEYKATFWIEAGQKESLERDIIHLHRTLFGLAAVAGSEIVEVENALTMMKSWFSGRQGPWLMVFDGADAIEDEKASGYIDIRHFIPDVASLHVVITSRSSAVGEMTQLESVQVGEMDEVQATELFYRYSQLPRDDAGIRDEVKAIVRELGCLALAVTLAGSYVGTTQRLQSHVKGYLVEYRQRRRELLKRKPERLVHQYSESVLTTWETSHRAVSEQCPEASVLMAMLSCLSSDDIFLGLFSVNEQLDDTRRTGEEDDTSWRCLLYPDLKLDRYRIEEYFRVLQKFSLVQWKVDQQSYAMHKLVHAWGFDRLTGHEQYKTCQAAFRLVLEAIEVVNGSHLSDEKLRVVPHVMANFAALGSRTGGWEEATEGLLDDLDKVSLFLNSVGKWSEEYAVQEIVLGKRRRVLGEEHPATIFAMNNLANTLGEQGQLDKAAKMLKEVLEKMRQILGEEHPSTIFAMNNLASTLGEQGYLDKAAKMLKEVLEKMRQILGEEHPDTISVMNNLASTLGEQGQLDEAAKMNKDVLEKRRQILGEEHPDTISAMNNIASILGEQGYLDEAAKMKKEVLEKRQRILGEEHPSTISAMNNLATTLVEQGQLDKAAKMMKEVLEKRRQILGDEHPSTISVMNNLASTLGEQGQLDKAAKMMKEVLEKRQRILGEEHPDTISAMHNLALTLGKQGYLDEAANMLKEVLEKRRRVLGEEHPHTKKAVQDLGIVTQHQSVQLSSVRTPNR
jgi:tetratricopeptide (TPR) repeat protein